MYKPYLLLAVLAVVALAASLVMPVIIGVLLATDSKSMIIGIAVTWTIEMITIVGALAVYALFCERTVSLGTYDTI